jgi:hypothetical protein
MRTARRTSASAPAANARFLDLDLPRSDQSRVRAAVELEVLAGYEPGLGAAQVGTRRGELVGCSETIRGDRRGDVSRYASATETPRVSTRPSPGSPVAAAGRFVQRRRRDYGVHNSQLCGSPAYGSHDRTIGRRIPRRCTPRAHRLRIDACEGDDAVSSVRSRLRRGLGARGMALRARKRRERSCRFEVAACVHCSPVVGTRSGAESAVPEATTRPTTAGAFGPSSAKASGRPT